MNKRSFVIAAVMTAITLTHEAEAELFDSIGTLVNAISILSNKNKSNSGQVADSNHKALADKFNQKPSPQAASAAAVTSPINVGNEVSANSECIGEVLEEQGKPGGSPANAQACNERAGIKQEQQALLPAENIKKPLTNEDIQREIAAIYADPNTTDANKAFLRKVEAMMPPNATPEQHAKVLQDFRAVVARSAQLPQQPISPYQAQNPGMLEGVGALFGGMAVSRAASQSAYNTAMSGGGLDSSRAVLNQVGNGGGSGGAINGAKAELVFEGAKIVGGFIGSFIKKSIGNSIENISNANGNGN